ncbi:unnamed protein product [Darwinula stevensoni]|uniref:Peptidase S1 domain-containing protein n=1 Tax=Darwinula stevensoni TaxID=69355 RepID=A0A7R8X239_9CRUS|nr:unnamed protein product [Darwinula stevensoni]CAG0881038.1 unnamed protein product [Darwinula stevensoni]
MEVPYFTLFLRILFLIHGLDGFGGEEEPLKRQNPPCSSTQTLTNGQSSPLNTGTNLNIASCSWKFTCPNNMTLQCSIAYVPCPQTTFVANNIRYYYHDHNNPDHNNPDHNNPDHNNPDHNNPDHNNPDHNNPDSYGYSNDSYVCGVSQLAPMLGRSMETKKTQEEDLDRIVGGTAVLDQRKYPWMAYFGGCGGALINDRYVLTAAHCITSQSATVSVTLGDLDKSNPSDGDTITISATPIVHPQYNAQTIDNDVALLQLNTSVDFTAHPTIRPICLSSSAKPVAGQNVVIAGWGTTSFGGSVSSVMREAVVKIDDQATCASAYNPYAGGTGRSITGNMFCASGQGMDACQVGRRDGNFLIMITFEIDFKGKGDSGGPAMQKNTDGSFVEIGIVSWGYGCADPLFPGVYTVVANYVDNFIRDNTKDAVVCRPLPPIRGKE